MQLSGNGIMAEHLFGPVDRSLVPECKTRFREQTLQSDMAFLG